MGKVVDGMLYGVGGALGMLIGFTLANDVAPFVAKLRYLIF